MEELLKEFHQKLTTERIHGTNLYEADITKCYKKILEGLILDYASYRKFVPHILSSLEENKSKSIAYSLFIFDDMLINLLSRQEYTPFDKSVICIKPTDKAVENCKLILETNLKVNNAPRLSEKLFDTCGLSTDEKKEIIALLIDRLQFDATKIVWTNEEVDSNLMCLFPLRALASELGNLNLFYLPTGIFLDHLCLSEFHQQARNFAEELLICGFNDDVREFGFFTSFRIYSNQNNVQAAFLYGNLTLLSLLHKTPPYSEKIIQEIIWQSLKFIRNIGLHDFVEKYYKSIPSVLNISPYEKRAIDQTYFTSLLKSQSASLPQTLLDYLHKERESIIKGNIPDCTPWLIFLYNVKRVYKNADFSPTGLGFYLSIFEQIVPPDNVKRFKNIIEGSVPELKSYLRESYIKLMETASVSDVEYDNDTALKIANRIIVNGFNDSDFEAILLAMVVKSDYSLVHKDKDSIELTPFILPDVNNPEKLFSSYASKDKILEEFNLLNNEEIAWIVETEGNLFQLSFFLGEFNFYQLPQWNGKQFHLLKQQEYYSSFEFETSKKDKFGSVYAITPEEYQDESQEVINKISFSHIISTQSSSLFVVKDMEISVFPHNLLLNQDQQFIFLSKPITNILSTEWYLNNIKSIDLSSDFSKSIWIPTEAGDMTLNYLYSNIEDCVKSQNFDIHHSVSLDNPLSSDLNIIGSHGAKDISQIKVIYPDNNPLINLKKIIGPGKILVFFVCYSGSQSTDFFKNSVSSLVKEFIAQGYQSIIAPAWALRVDVPPIWLPAFLESLNNGEPISIAHHKANMAVHEKYPTPAAWACLHLFGNPNVKIK